MKRVIRSQEYIAGMATINPQMCNSEKIMYQNILTKFVSIDGL